MSGKKREKTIIPSVVRRKCTFSFSLYLFSPSLSCKMSVIFSLFYRVLKLIEIHSIHQLLKLEVASLVAMDTLFGCYDNEN